MASASPSDTVACALERRLHSFNVGMQTKTANTNSNGVEKAKNGRLTGVEKAVLEAEWRSPSPRAGPGAMTTTRLLPCYNGLGVADPACSKRMLKLGFQPWSGGS